MGMFLKTFKLLAFFCCIWGSTPFNYTKEMAEFYSKYYFGRAQYLTILALYLTLITVVIQRLTKCTESRRLKQLANILLPVALSIELTVTCVYWILYTFRPDFLFFKDEMRDGSLLELFNELCLHLFPVLLLAAEAFESNAVFKISHF